MGRREAALLDRGSHAPPVSGVALKNGMEQTLPAHSEPLGLDK